mgnify:CR=1 FL=1
MWSKEGAVWYPGGGPGPVQLGPRQVHDVAGIQVSNMLCRAGTIIFLLLLLLNIIPYCLYFCLYYTFSTVELSWLSDFKFQDDSPSVSKYYSGLFRTIVFSIAAGQGSIYLSIFPFLKCPFSRVLSALDLFLVLKYLTRCL